MSDDPPTPKPEVKLGERGMRTRRCIIEEYAANVRELIRKLR